MNSNLLLARQECYHCHHQPIIGAFGPIPTDDRYLNRVLHLGSMLRRHNWRIWRDLNTQSFGLKAQRINLILLHIHVAHQEGFAPSVIGLRVLRLNLAWLLVQIGAEGNRLHVPSKVYKTIALRLKLHRQNRPPFLSHLNYPLGRGKTKPCICGCLGFHRDYESCAKLSG